MEDIESEKISEGAHTGLLYHARGIHSRGEGRDQERDLAEKYHTWVSTLQCFHPFISSTLLMSMVKTDEHDASREDAEAGIRQRLH